MCAGILASWTTSIVEPIACRSMSEGLHGTNAISEARAASRAAISVCGAVSRIASVAPLSSVSFRMCCKRSECVEMTAGVSPSRLSRHFAAEDCGSKSMRAVVCPERSAATDRCVTSFVLPVPPFLCFRQHVGRSKWVKSLPSANEGTRSWVRH